MAVFVQGFGAFRLAISESIDGDHAHTDSASTLRGSRGLVRMMAVFVQGFGAFRLAISESIDGDHAHTDSASTLRGSRTVRQPSSPIQRAPSLKPQTCRSKITGGSVRGG